MQPWIAAIVADQEDDVTRLAFADWLAEHGCQELEVCIRWQVEHGKRPHPLAMARTFHAAGWMWSVEDAYPALSCAIPGALAVEMGLPNLGVYATWLAANEELAKALKAIEVAGVQI